MATTVPPEIRGVRRIIGMLWLQRYVATANLIRRHACRALKIYFPRTGSNAFNSLSSGRFYHYPAKCVGWM